MADAAPSTIESMLIRVAAHLELELMERELEAHGSAVLQLLRCAVEAFLTADAAAGERAAKMEREVRMAHDRIDAAASRLLAERWEVSTEVRRAIATRRVNDELLGVTELATAIARLAQPSALASEVVELDELALAAESCIRGAMLAFVSRSPGRASLLTALESLVDEAMRDAGSAVLARAPLHPGAGEWALRAMLTARCLGRISQHGLRIACQAGFVATGREPGGEDVCHAS